MALWIDSKNQVHDDMNGAALALPSWPQGMTPYTIPEPTNEQLLAEASMKFKLSAQILLDATDLVAFRCFKAGVAYPAEWQSYTLALRNIVNGTNKSTSLPSKPAYPAGT
jgi:hypothetical protein